MNDDELHGTKKNLMPIQGQRRTLPECRDEKRRGVAAFWSSQVDAAALLGDDGDERR